MTKIYFSIILVFLGTKLFSQDLNDLIITKNLDSIKCKITLVNDENIFYKYKKKRHIKTTYISRSLILDFKGNDLKELTIKREDLDRYKKCDTCQNWLVDKDGDTIFYNLVVKYMKIPSFTLSSMTEFGSERDSSLIESIAYEDSTTFINYNICEVQYISWEGRNYFTFKPDYRYDHHNLKYQCENFLGFYLVKNSVSLIRYSSVYENVNSNIYKNTNGLIHNESSRELSMSYSKSIKTTPEYCIEIDNLRIMIPKKNREKHFRIAIMEVLHKDKKLVERIKNKEFEYEDIEEIIKIYNQNLK
jgi:hypothetical protein